MHKVLLKYYQKLYSFKEQYLLTLHNYNIYLLYKPKQTSNFRCVIIQKYFLIFCYYYTIRTKNKVV